jgi:hypothetical protein
MASKPTKKRHTWPEHPPGPRAHIYAIGVLSAYYNDLEDTFLKLLQHFSASPDELIALIFEKTPTNVRIQLLERAMDLRGVDAATRAIMDHFLKAYGICTNNRGLLVHSRMWAYRKRDNAAIATKRVRKSGEQWTYEFPLKMIRQVADDIHFWRSYGSYLYAYLNRLALSRQKLPKGASLFGPTTLPGTPDLPENLLDKFHSKGGKPPIPQFP